MISHTVIVLLIYSNYLHGKKGSSAADWCEQPALGWQLPAEALPRSDCAEGKSLTFIFPIREQHTDGFGSERAHFPAQLLRSILIVLALCRL